MSAGVSFLKRVSGAFKSDGGRGNGNGATLILESLELRAGDGAHAPHRSTGSSLLPWVRARHNRELADERYQSVIELMVAMREHFERQDRHAGEMAEALAGVGATLKELAETQGKQCDQVTSIAARMSDAARHSEGLFTMLSEMPASMQSQAEAVRTVAQHMESGRAADAELSGSLRQFSEAANALRGAGTAQAEALQRLHDDGRRRGDKLHGSLRRQSRLLLAITIIVCVLGIGLVGVLGVVARMIFTA